LAASVQVIWLLSFDRLETDEHGNAMVHMCKQEDNFNRKF